MKLFSKIGLSAISVLYSSIAFAQEFTAPAMAGDNAAVDPAIQAGSFTAVLAEMLPMFLMIVFIFYFLVIRPQAKQIKEHSAMLAGLAKGDEVLTTAGLFGRIAGIEKDYILLEVSNGVKVKFLSSSIVKKVEKEA